MKKKQQEPDPGNPVLPKDFFKQFKNKEEFSAAMCLGIGTVQL